MPFFYRSGGASSTQAGVNSYNYLVNGAFDYWQVGTSATIAATGGSTPTASYLYQSDQWYVNNILGGGTIEGVITFSQQAAASSGGAPSGSLYRANVKITTAPTGTGVQNGCELWQTLSNGASLSLYNQTASFGVYVLGLGNVTQVGLQFFYQTSEIKGGTAIGSEVLTTVASSTWTLCSLNGQALGTSQTTAGVIGVRIRITGVSSGNAYDLNNGFSVEQAMLNLGSQVATFSRQNPNPSDEIMACQYFYEKSYDLTTALGTATEVGMFCYPAAVAAATNYRGTVFFKASKRTDPSMSFWDIAGTASKYSYINAAAARTDGATASAAWAAIGQGSAAFDSSPGITASAVEVHWAADARI